MLAFAAYNTLPLHDTNGESLRSIVLEFAVIIFELLIKDDIVP